MEADLLAFPITCPVCATESLTKIPYGEVAANLVARKPIPLISPCHSIRWNANALERAQIRDYLIASYRTGKVWPLESMEVVRPEI